MRDKPLGSAARRRFLRGAGGLLALPAFPLTLHGSPAAAARELAPLAAGRGLVVYRESDAHCRAFAGAMRAAGLDARALGLDPVRQWRDGLGVQSLGRPLAGMGNWTDFLLVSGLAAEQRRHSLVQWRHPLPAGGDSAWAAQHARALTVLAPIGDAEEIESAMRASAGGPAAGEGRRLLFSWVIT